MGGLILPNSEVHEIIVPTRRFFIKGTATALTSLFVAPAIIPAANLMQIHSPTNKLIVAYQKYTNRNTKYPSYLNLTDWTAEYFRAWEAIHPSNVYSLVRQGEIEPQHEKMIGGTGWIGEGLTEAEIQADIKRQQADARTEIVEREIRYFLQKKALVREYDTKTGS